MHITPKYFKITFRKKYEGSLKIVLMFSDLHYNINIKKLLGLITKKCKVLDIEITKWKKTKNDRINGMLKTEIMH